MRNAAAPIVPSAPSFSARLGQFKDWRDALAAAIGDYQACRERLGITDGTEDLRIFELIERLKSDKLVIALVAEFSRGKTELLNALFFSSHKQRLLPSTAGRTTMCPTELCYNEKESASIKLLPIETRKTSTSIAEYKRTAIHWTTLHILKPNSTDELRELFLEVTKTKKVHKREAEELGLFNPDSEDDVARLLPKAMIEIPVWRHAIINYPHPLLKQGLVVLDTPGLNVLGAEPELTLSMLPEAHGTIFVLAADIGVTKTDLEIWRKHVDAPNRPKNDGLIVVLNKVDALWDELQNEAAISKTLNRQIEETARTLKIDKSLVLPISSKAGLTGNAKGDKTLIERSGLPLLEKRLAEDIVPARHEIIRRKVVYEVNGLIENTRALLDSKLAATKDRLAELRDLGGQNLDAIRNTVAKVRAEKTKYDKELEGFQVTRATLYEQAKSLLANLSTENFDGLVAKTRRDMRDSWTTLGLKAGIKSFFRGAVERMDRVSKQADEIRKTVETLYRRLHAEYGLPEITPARLSLLPYLMELKSLEKKSEAYRSSTATYMTEQRFVIKKFFVTLVSAARSRFVDADSAVKSWFQAIVSPLFIQIKEHKLAIDRHLKSLKSIHSDFDNLNLRITELERVRVELKEQIKLLDGIMERIHKPFH
jgi:hypothetical protein